MVTAGLAMACALLAPAKPAAPAKGTTRITYRYAVTGAVSGTATVTTTLVEGQKTVTTAMALDQEGQKTNFTSTKSYDSKGFPISIEEITKGPTDTVTRKAVFHDKKILLHVSAKGKSQDKSVVITQIVARDLTDPSQFWFLTTHPKPGAVVRCATFSVQNWTFEKTITTYIGKRSLELGKHHFESNLVNVKTNDSSADVYLDDSGSLLRFDGPTFRMDRTF